MNDMSIIEKINRYILKRKLEKKHKNYLREKLAILTLVHEGTWKITDHHTLTELSSIKKKISETETELNKLKKKKL